jgi:hypothetical protein
MLMLMLLKPVDKGLNHNAAANLQQCLREQLAAHAPGQSN